MSTRATIKIQEGHVERWLYHHCDGYPEGVGEDLDQLLNTEKRWSIESIFYRLTEDEEYEPTKGQHGDEEYAYLINCDDMSLVCYSIGWDEYDWKTEVFRREYDRCDKEKIAPFLVKECFLCEFCRKICSAKCHEQLENIQNGVWKPGDKEYEENKDLIGRKHIITCLGPYCDKPCKYQQLDYLPYKESDKLKPLFETIKFLGNKVNELIAEKNS